LIIAYQLRPGIFAEDRKRRRNHDDGSQGQNYRANVFVHVQIVRLSEQPTRSVVGGSSSSQLKRSHWQHQA
jgi:hypothetical protein